MSLKRYNLRQQIFNIDPRVKINRVNGLRPPVKKKVTNQSNNNKKDPPKYNYWVLVPLILDYPEGLILQQ